MNEQEFQGLYTPSFALPDTEPDSSATAVTDAKPDENRTVLDDHYRTWNWQEAADELGVKEPTLRKIWWGVKLEPVFRHCPEPLRVVTRTTATKEIEEFTPFGMEVLKAYKTAKEKGDRAAEMFLAEAKAKYPVPTPPAPSPATAVESDPIHYPAPLQIAGLESLTQHQQAQAQVLSLRGQSVQSLSAANQTRLAQLREFLRTQSSQYQREQALRIAQLEAEGQNEAIEEFLIKQQAKNAVLSQLEQLNSLGKLTSVSDAPPAG